MAPLAAVGQAEVAPVARGAAKVDRQEGEPLLDQQLAERLEVAEDLPGGPAVRVDDGRDAPPAALPGGGGGTPERHRDRQPIAGPDHQALGLDEAADGHDRGQRARQAPRPDTGAVGGGNRQDPEVLRVALRRADRQDPTPVREPVHGPPDAVDRVDPDPGKGLGSMLRRPAGAAPGGGGGRDGRDDQVDEPVAEQGVDEAAPVGRGEGRQAESAVVVAVLRGAGREGRPIAADERHADDLEPAVPVGGDQEPAAVGKPARARLPCRQAGNDALLAAGGVDDGDLHGGEIGVALGQHRDPAAVR